MQMWRTMYECHQVQNHIAQQMNNLSNHPSTEPTTDYHRQATVQFEAEVTSWYNTFCNLLTSQREFVRALNQWVRLTDFLPNNSPTNSTSEIYALCEEWKLAVERLPDKVLWSFLSVFFEVPSLDIWSKRTQNQICENLAWLTHTWTSSLVLISFPNFKEKKRMADVNWPMDDVQRSVHWPLDLFIGHTFGPGNVHCNPAQWMADVLHPCANMPCVLQSRFLSFFSRISLPFCTLDTPKLVMCPYYVTVLQT